MQTLHNIGILVKCPHCGTRFSPEEAIGHDLRVQLEKEFSKQLEENSRKTGEKVRREEQDRYAEQLSRLKEEVELRAKKLKAAESESIRLQELERNIREKEERFELDMKKRLLEREKLIREEAERVAIEKALLQMREREQKLEWEKERLEVMLRKRVQEEAEKVREEEQMKSAELQKKLDDQHKLINEMKRKSEQGSMQVQGEVQELAIEEYLRGQFPADEVEEIAKGKRGGDCVHIVRDQFRRVCGKILYESKRTRHFSHEWLAKVRDDMRLKQADLAVIVTEALPDGMHRFGEIEGIWVCSFAEFKALALVFRSNLIRLGEITSAQENRGEKSQMIYSYVTGTEFRQKLEAAFESFQGMQEELMKEKVMMTSQWAKREKRMVRAMENLVSLYGDVRGIAGGAVPVIHALEAESTPALEE